MKQKAMYGSQQARVRVAMATRFESQSYFDFASKSLPLHGPGGVPVLRLAEGAAEFDSKPSSGFVASAQAGANSPETAVSMNSVLSLRSVCSLYKPLSPQALLDLYVPTSRISRIRRIPPN